MESCANCKFWERSDPQPSATTCHRFPRPYDQLITTHKDYWCGEFKPVTKKKED